MFEENKTLIKNKQISQQFFECKENKIISPLIRTHSAPVTLGRTNQYTRFAGSVNHGWNGDGENVMLASTVNEMENCGGRSSASSAVVRTPTCQRASFYIHKRSNYSYQ